MAIELRGNGVTVEHPGGNHIFVSADSAGDLQSLVAGIGHRMSDITSALDDAMRIIQVVAGEGDEQSESVNHALADVWLRRYRVLAGGKDKS